MTEEQRQEKIAARIKEQAKAIKERKANEIKEGFLNPFGEQTTYNEFLEQVSKSKKSVADYCKGKLTEDQIDWLEKELSILKNE